MTAQDISFAAQADASGLSVSTFTQDPIRARAVLAEEYRRSRLIWSLRPNVDPQNRHAKLLAENRVHAITLPSGRYLTTEKVKDDDLLLVRAVTHEDYEILMQIEHGRNKTLYHRLSKRFLFGDEFKEARGLHREITGPIEENNASSLFNYMISTAWELVFLVDKGYLAPKEELSPQERRFADIMRPFLYEKTAAGAYKNFPSVFFDPAERMRAVLRLQKDPTRRFARTAGSRLQPQVPSRAPSAQPLASMAIAVNLLDIGAEIADSGKITNLNNIEKLIEIVPELARDGIGKVYLYGGVYPVSKLSVDLHQVPTPERRFLHDGKATVMTENYHTKKKQAGELSLRDYFGNSFSIYGMDRWNPDLSSGDVDAAMRRLVNTIHASGMKAIVDFIPWLSPGAINEKNYRWTFYYELSGAENEEFRSLPEERKDAWIESIVGRDGRYCAVRIKEDGIERVIRVKHLEFYGSHSSDQVLLNPFSAEVREYYHQSIKRIIDTGFDEVRVDLPGLLLRSNAGNYPTYFRHNVLRDWWAQEELWRNLIRHAKGYAGRHGKEFRFNMESYDRGEQDTLSALGANASYDSGIFHTFWRISREGDAAWALDGPVKKALWERSRLLIFPTNFDQMSLKAIGGSRNAYMMLIIALTHLGVGSMVDLREYLGHAGHIVPIVGGNNSGKDGHPFIDESEVPARKNFEATKRALAGAPFKKLIEDFYAAVDTRKEQHITILNNSNTRRYFSIGWMTERDDWQILLIDTRPQDKKVPVQVELPSQNHGIVFIPSQFIAIDSRDKKALLPITQWDTGNPASPAVVAVPIKDGEEYAFLHLAPVESLRSTSEGREILVERLRESVRILNKTALESGVQDTAKSWARPLSNSLPGLRREARDLESIAKLRLAVPIEILKNSADMALAFAKISTSDPAFRKERIPFELVVTGARDETDIRAVEALKNDELRKAFKLTGDITVSMITKDEIEDAPKRDKRFNYDASTPSGRARIIKDMTVGTLAEGEYACIVTDAADDSSAQNMVKEFESESGSSGRIAMMVPVKSSEHGVFLLSQIVNEWFNALNKGDGSAVRKILPPMISPAELMRRLADSMRMVWVALSAA
jgi:hypothetical protein